jgi:hypothetical protein
MRKFSTWFSWIVIILYFGLGIFVLVSPRFRDYPRQVKIIFAVFLFLYGSFRAARLWTKKREQNEE